MIEQWRAVPDYEGFYEVSNLGRVRSIHRMVRAGHGSQRTAASRVMALRADPRGYLLVALSRDGRYRHRKVHQLVLLAFVGPRPSGMVACHNDDDKVNNVLANLRWDTESANARDRVRNGHDSNASKTHCKRGHEFDEANTYQKFGIGRRECRACSRLKRRQYAAAAREAMAS